MFLGLELLFQALPSELQSHFKILLIKMILLILIVCYQRKSLH